MERISENSDAILKKEAEALLAGAKEARKFSYAPYSRFKVGAALLTEDDEIITGCNVENAAYSPGNCAERTAMFKAVSEGKTKWKAIAIAGGKDADAAGTFCAPCGVCRQVMREFCSEKTFRIYVTDGNEIRMYTLEELLPLSFGPEKLTVL